MGNQRITGVLGLGLRLAIVDERVFISLLDSTRKPWMRTYPSLHLLHLQIPRRQPQRLPRRQSDPKAIPDPEEMMSVRVR